ncbi:MAG: signal peptidase I [Clostridia bacterium]|nr:signal peptidase I [Clostridia bacterium]
MNLKKCLHRFLLALKKLCICLFLAVLLINVYVIGARAFMGDPLPTVFGYSWAVISSGSMEPAIKVNDMVIIKKQDDYNVGDIVTYRSGNISVTHRVVEKSDTGCITKGDFNNVEDPYLIPMENIVGRVVGIVPWVGLFVGYLKTPKGVAGLVIIGLILALKPMVGQRESKEGGKAENETV